MYVAWKFSLPAKRLTWVNDLKPSKQCVSAVKKANMTLGMIKRHIVSRDKKTIVRLH